MPETEAVIVGGSLSGLTFALACARRGIRTCVLERTRGPRRGGGALGIDRDLLLRVIGKNEYHRDEDSAFPVLAGRRRAVLWQSIHHWLRGQALQCPEIILHDGVSVVEIAENVSCATVTSNDGHRFEASLIVGADGYQSRVRCAISPEQADASYAGYLLWRGLVHEVDLPLVHFPQENGEAALVNAAGYRLIAYPVASPTGSLAPGQRLIDFAWYEAGRHALLRDLRCLSDGDGVVRSLSAEDVPASVRDELCSLARRIWPDPWRSAILHSLAHRQVFATPVAEYSPTRLYRGRLTIIGDAAHVASPATGKGFVHGMRDAETLAECLAGAAGDSGENLFAALKKYENERLPEAQALVASSVAWGRAFLQRRPTVFSSSQAVIFREGLTSQRKKTTPRGEK